MRIIRDSSEDEMVLAFLRAEIDSPGFRDHLEYHLKTTGCTRTIIDNADLRNEEQNRVRTSCLGSWRGFKNNQALFRGFPDNVRWKLLSLFIQELGRSKYANHPTWNMLSEGTRQVSDGAKNVDLIPELAETSSSIKAIEQKIRRGVQFPELILVATRKNSDLILVEGHKRATAIFRAKNDLAGRIRVIAGYSINMSNWYFY